MRNALRQTAPRAILLLSLTAAGMTTPSAAQARRSVADFRGDWAWAVYTKDRNGLPPAYQNMRLKDVPRDSLDLTLRQSGSRLRGDCGATARFLARVENASFTTTAAGNTARLRLESGFGGSIIATITRRGSTLLWKVVKADGEEYFPQQAILHRVLRKRRT